MPNWVYNGLTIEGNPEQVKSLIKQMNTPFVDSIKPNGDLSYSVTERKYSNPIFSFRNIIAPTDLEAYHSIPVFPEKFDMKFEGNDWYNFNNRNWGTKWDVAVSDEDKYSNTSIQESENGENYVVYYNFETAWSRPLGAIEKLSAQYPTLLFTLSYEEETGWGGEMEFLKGEIISSSEYDNMCRDCDATDCLEYCENECGEICSVCHWLGEADLEAVAECDDHKIYLETKVPEYRKVEA
jgi:hypothetical protein